MKSICLSPPSLFSRVYYQRTKKRYFCLLAGVLLNLLMLPQLFAAPIIIDDFSDDQNKAEATGAGNTASTVQDGGMLGGERDIWAKVNSGGNDVDGRVNTGNLSIAMGSGTDGEVKVVWDGNDDDGDTVSATGLSGVDLTNGGTLDGVELTLISSDQDANVTLTVYTSATDASEITFNVVEVTVPNTIYFVPFSLFTTKAGGGADFANVGAIEFFTSGTALDMSVELMQTNASLTATKTYALQTDLDSDGVASPGDTIRYTVTITNPDDAFDATATNVVYNATADTNTTMTGTITTTQGGFTTGDTAGDTGAGVNIGNITDGTSVTITYDVLIDQPLGTAVTQLSMQGTVTSDDLPGGLLTDDTAVGGTADATVTPVVQTVIGDFIWNDLNDDGVQDGGAETGITGVTVDAWFDFNNDNVANAGDGDVLLGTLTTDGAGAYSFGLPNFTNFVIDVTDTGNVLTLLEVSTGTTNPQGPAVASGTTDNTIDFGYKVSNTAPVAVADAYGVNEGATININAAAGVLDTNDTDGQGDALTAILVTDVGNGTLTLNVDGSFDYTHDGSETTTDSFTYKANDGALDSNTVTVTITVTPVNDAPVAVADSHTVDEGATLNIDAASGVLDSNDTDVEGDGLTAVLVSDVSNGTLTLSGDGSFDYTHDGSETTTDSFTYKANDGTDDSNTVTVTITVNPVNDAPVAVADGYGVDEGATLNINAASGVLDSNDTDAEGDGLTAALVSDVGNGTLTLNADGSFDYTHDGSETTTDSFTYRANDGTDNSNTVTVTITVTPVNDAPVAVADAYSVDEGATLNVDAASGVLDSNDTDAEGDGLTAILVSDVANGTLTLNGDGSFDYTHDGSETTTDSFTYKANDGSDDSNTVTVTITVNAVNDAPVATTESYTTTEGDTLTVSLAQGIAANALVSVVGGILDNDTDAENDPLTAVLVSTTSNGTLSLNTDGSFDYIHDGSETTSDSFVYKANDGALDSADTTVTINITPVNDAPVANDDSAAVNEDSQVTIQVLNNDTDAEAGLQPSSVTVTSAPSQGQTSVNTSNGTVTYIPNPNFNGSDSFVYQVSDGDGASDTATVTITVNAVNDAPVANNDNVQISEDNAVAIAVSDNDSDIDSSLDLTSIVITGGPGNGTVTVNGDGTVTYTPALNFNGSDSFNYQINDAQGQPSNSAVVVITVTGLNDPPLAVNDAVTLDEDTPIGIAVLSNDSDVEDSSLSATTIAITLQPTQGTVAVDVGSGQVIYTPNANSNGSDSFNYTVMDSEGYTSNVATVSLTITPVNDAPLAADDTAVVDEDSEIMINVMGNDSDVDSVIDISSVRVERQPDNGTVVINADGSVSYTPGDNFNGIDSFTYSIADVETLRSNIATVTLTINPVNDAPVVNDDSATVDEDATVNIDVLSNDSDSDGNVDETTVSVVDQPRNGSVVVNADGTISYTPDENFNGTDTFTYQVNDNEGDVSANTATVTVTVNPLNDVPEAVDDTATTDEDTPATIDVLGNDSDPDGDALTVTSATVDNGSVTINDNGELEYTPPADFNGTATIDYCIVDDSGAESCATVTVTVEPLNDAPVANDGSAQTNENTPLDISLTDLVSDVDGDPLTTTSATAGNGTVVINADGTITYTPNPGFVGEDVISYCVSDGNGGEACATVTVTVVNVNDAPQVNDHAFTVAEDTPLNFSVSGSDPDGDALSFEQLTAPASGQLNGNLPNSLYLPAADFNGTVAFTYQASDGVLVSNPGTVTITVTPVNDAPIANDDSVTIDSGEPTAIDVLPNDSDIDGDTLIIVGATANTGTVSWTGSELNYTPPAGFFGTATIEYTISDGNGGTDTARVFIEITPPDVLVNIIPPDDVFTDATALFTKLDLGQASATDRFGNPLPVSLVDGITFFEPGVNTAFWTATDADGNTAMAAQQVSVRPLVSLDRDQTVLEGLAVSVGVHLNGTSQSYPLQIPYSVSGSATGGEDHNLGDGLIVIESGSEGVISFEVLDDVLFDDQETIIITLDEVLNRGNKFSHTITISELNVDPEVLLKATQQGEERLLVSKDAPVLVTSLVLHPDSSNSYDYQWSNLEGQLVDSDNSETTFTFDPANLAAGLYHLSLTVTDSDDPAFNDSEILYIEVVEELVALGTGDSDLDGVPDNVEGYADSDGDGIADYLDPIPECNVLPEQVDFIDGYLVEGDPGVCLRRGDLTIGGETGGAEITSDDIAADGEDLLIEDTQAENVGGIFDFIAYGLPDAGQSYKIVMPQIKPIPANAIYRKLMPAVGWVTFTETDKDQLWSSPGEAGFCQPPGDDVWERGLIEGYWCAQIVIEDGGINDADGLANSTVVDPGGVGVLLTSNNQPLALDDEAQTRINIPITIMVLPNDSDPDGDPLTIDSANAVFGSVTIEKNPGEADRLFFTPNENFIGIDRITYGITDSQGGTAFAMVTVLVNANAFPVAVDDGDTTLSGEPVVVAVINNDSDPEDDPLQVVTANVDEGSVVINADNSLTYTPADDFVGTATITYTIADSFGDTATAIVTIVVDPATTDVTINTSGGGSLWQLLLGLLILTALRRYRVYLRKTTR